MKSLLAGDRRPTDAGLPDLADSKGGGLRWPPAQDILATWIEDRPLALGPVAANSEAARLS